MKLVIDIPEVYYESLKNTEWIISGQRSGKTLQGVIYNAIKNGTPLPKTNGEVLMTMFPPSVYYGKDKRLMLLAKDTCLECTNDDWWNAEYKGATNENSD